MNARLTLPNHRIITPVTSLLMVIAFAATLALGFGLRAWTEHSAGISSPAAPVARVHPAAPQTLVKMGKPW